MSQSKSLDAIDSALVTVMRLSKRPAYWEEFQSIVGQSIDRPSMAILLMLSDQPLRFQEVVQRLGVEAPSISRKVHELELAGLIMRTPTDDRRVHLLSLTAKGNNLAKDIASARRQMLKLILNDWDDDEQIRFSELITLLADGMSNRYGNKIIRKEQ